MLPTLVSLGPVKIYSYGVCLAIGLFVGLYFWWKMGRDEHWDEIALFDGFFLSVITYLVAGRAGYVVLHLSEVGTVYRSLAILAFPGINAVVGIVAVIILMILFARDHGWDEWRVADALVVALSIILVLTGLGGVLNGSSPVWQVNVWGVVWAIITFAIVSRVRKNFRFYAWYKGGSSMAQEGLASLVFVSSVGVYYLGVRQYLVGIGAVAVSSFLIYRRVGRRDTSLWGRIKSIITRSK